MIFSPRAGCWLSASATCRNVGFADGCKACSPSKGRPPASWMLWLILACNLITVPASASS
eukprot:CAMPEP_0179173866 /NCGR_PEP_ID=MMETSP0796-20121207/85819_1 /TAXON_ID=73915 /ORGANISM="Pyrodinium bahamense, Strain pbaha01" /LENGTH=59 /DNA_ID=CAMNT_0020877127 /DNA_START=70 /DNA_END=249 /DNA_ORIENTATION=+